MCLTHRCVIAGYRHYIFWPEFVSSSPWSLERIRMLRKCKSSEIYFLFTAIGTQLSRQLIKLRNSVHRRFYSLVYLGGKVKPVF